MYLFL